MTSKGGVTFNRNAESFRKPDKKSGSIPADAYRAEPTVRIQFPRRGVSNYRFRAGLPTLRSDRQQPVGLWPGPVQPESEMRPRSTTRSFRPKLISASPIIHHFSVLPAPKPIGEAL
jgi:hypothetical protein